MQAFCPDAEITTMQDNVKESKFDIAFMKTFDIVLNGLDNVEARRHVNRLCLAADLPLIESGTTGYKGQVPPSPAPQHKHTLLHAVLNAESSHSAVSVSCFAPGGGVHNGVLRPPPRRRRGHRKQGCTATHLTVSSRALKPHAWCR